MGRAAGESWSNSPGSQFPKPDQLLHRWGGVCPLSSPPPPPLLPPTRVQSLHHFDGVLLSDSLTRRCCRCPRCCRPTFEKETKVKGADATQRGAGRSGPLGVPPDGGKGLQPAADHLQGEWVLTGCSSFHHRGFDKTSAEKKKKTQNFGLKCVRWDCALILRWCSGTLCVREGRPSGLLWGLHLCHS